MFALRTHSLISRSFLALNLSFGVYAWSRATASPSPLPAELASLAPVSLLPAAGFEAKFQDQTGFAERAEFTPLTAAAAGAPIHGIGVQGHIGQQPRAPELVLSDLDLLAGEGLPVQITEFDVNTKDE